MSKTAYDMLDPSKQLFLTANTINSDMFNKYTDAERSGILDSYDTLLKKGTLANDIAKGIADNNSSWFGKQDWSMSGLGGTLLSAGQLGLGFLSYLDKKKTAKLQRDILAQQAETNRYAFNKTKADNQHMLEVFNPTAAKTAKDGVLTQSGLASRYI